MSNPSKKSPQIENLLDSFSDPLYGRSRIDSIGSNVCVCCGGDATSFRDALSETEYSISGMCQSCQDSVFGSADN